MFQFSVIGSICALALTLCGYPLMLFGTGTFARVVWLLGLIMAPAFALLLLGVTVKSAVDFTMKKVPTRNVLFPVLALIFLYVAWWRIFDIWSRMP